MRLSTPRKSLVFVFFAMTLQGCSYCKPAPNTATEPQLTVPSEFPFSTKEPEVYQADAVVTTGETEDHTFIARKGAMHRTDIFQNEHLAVTEILSGFHYLIDHRRKIYYEEPAVGPGPTGFVSPAA